MSDIHSPHDNVNTDVHMNNRISFHGPVFITVSLVFSVPIVGVLLFLFGLWVSNYWLVVVADVPWIIAGGAPG